MKTRLCFVILWVANFLPAQPTTPQAGARTSVDLTIYNANFALVREERPMTFIKGLNTIIVPEIPATIDGTSLHFASLIDASSLKVLEQNFQYDLIHHAKMLEKYVGKEVEFVRLDESTKKEYTVKGKLLATGWQVQPGSNQYYFGGQMLAEVGGKVEVAPTGRLVLPPSTEGLILKPQLQWLVNAAKAGEQKTEISYIANQLSWACNYVAVLNAGDNAIDLTGWVTLTNNSGTTFTNAGLKLVAGGVNRIQEDLRGGRAYAKAMAMEEATEQQFQQKELFEYKLYALQRKTDLANNETKQIELTSGHNVAAKKVFVYDGLDNQWRWWMNNTGYRDQGTFGQQSNAKVSVFVIFKNEEKSGLGIPLPKGKVRVYKKDDENKEQFIGEDEIDHTPKDEELKLYLGNAFDIVGSRAQKEFRAVVSGHVFEETFEIKLRNHKKEEVEVLVYEHPWRWNEWEIKKASGEWEKVDQSTVKFPVRVKKDEEKVLTYTIRYNW